ncbi:MAG: hypothetical protein KatS3mg061_0254 [Dehalococcoidia bacterium]|nr:MAG: hypothetical protein KatS3mg061_0254 [Dehalococcoidia bacterium]
MTFAETVAARIPRQPQRSRFQSPPLTRRAGLPPREAPARQSCRERNGLQGVARRPSAWDGAGPTSDDRTALACTRVGRRQGTCASHCRGFCSADAVEPRRENRERRGAQLSGRLKVRYTSRPRCSERSYASRSASSAGCTIALLRDHLQQPTRKRPALVAIPQGEISLTARQAEPSSSGARGDPQVGRWRRVLVEIGDPGTRADERHRAAARQHWAMAHVRRTEEVPIRLHHPGRRT